MRHARSHPRSPGRVAATTACLFALQLAVGASETESNAAARPPATPTYTRPGADLLASAERILCKRTPQEDLRLHVLRPAGASSEPLPAIVYFSGGGWVTENVEGQIPVAAWFRDHGIIAITAEYRVRSRSGTTPVECVRDARSAVRYVRAHARELGIDPARIIVAGGSAGGHIAASTVLPTGDEPGEDVGVSCRADALVLHNPVLGEGFGREFFAEHPELSPLRGVTADWPPTILSCGTKDPLTPHEVAVKFTAAMQDAGNVCELITVPEAGHSCDWPVSNPNFLPTLQRMTAFLREQGLMP